MPTTAAWLHRPLPASVALAPSVYCCSDCGGVALPVVTGTESPVAAGAAIGVTSGFSPAPACLEKKRAVVVSDARLPISRASPETRRALLRDAGTTAPS